MPAERFPISIAGGVNRLQDPLRIQDDEVVSAQNIFPDQSGKPQKRRGAKFAGAIHASSGLLPLNLLFSGVDHARLGWVHLDTGTGDAYFGIKEDVVPAAHTGLSIKVASGRRPQLVNFQGRQYCLHGECPFGAPSRPPLYAAYYDTVTLALKVEGVAWEGTGNDDNPPRVAAQYRGRMVYADFSGSWSAPSNETRWRNHLLLSDFESPLTIGDNALTTRAFDLAAYFGSDRIVVAHEVPLTGGGDPTSTALYIGSATKGILMTGEPLQTGEVGDYAGDTAFVPLPRGCGCVSAETMVDTPWGVIWASADDVWLWVAGKTPVRVGTKIRPALTSGLRSEQYRWFATYHPDGWYKLSIVGANQGPSENGPCSEEWWLDLRGDIPTSAREAVWWGPMVYRIAVAESTDPAQGHYICATEDREAAAAYTFSLISSVYYASGPAALCLVNMEAEQGYDSCLNHEGEGLELVIGSPSAVPIRRAQGNTIDIDIWTKEYDLGDPGYDKLVLGTEFALWANDILALRVDTIVDGGRDSDIETRVIDQTGFVAGVSPEGTRITHEYQSVEVDTDPDKRLVGKVFQFHIYDVPGWAIAPSNYRFAYVFLPDPLLAAINPELYAQLLAGAVAYTSDLVLGSVYESVQDYLDALVAQMNADMAAIEAAAVFVHVHDDDVVRLTEDNGFFWSPVFGAVYGLSAANGLVSRKIGASLGYDTSAAELTAAVSQDGETSFRDRISAAVEFAGIVLKVHRFGRRPPHKGSDE